MEWLRRFMYGRNGADALTFVLAIFSAVLGLLRYVPYVGTWCWIVQMMVLGFAVFRVFSRNLEARRRENRIVTELRFVLQNWKVRQMNGAAHKFFRCPSCRNMLRVPRGKGKVFVTCPKCGERFQKKT